MKEFFVILLAMVLMSCATIKSNVQKKTKPSIQPNTQEKPQKKYTYDGDLNPAVFINWTRVPYMIEEHGQSYVAKNPTKHAAIKYALLYIAEGVSKEKNVPYGSLLSYVYIDDGKLRFFMIKNSRYKEFMLSLIEVARLGAILKPLEE